MEIPAKRNLFSNNVLTRDRESFRSSYAGSPPWDIGKPQPAFQAVADKVVGSVLDAGFLSPFMVRNARTQANASACFGPSRDI